MLVREGDRVKRGQTLFRLEATMARLQVDRAEAALAGAKVQWQAATQDHARATRLFDNKSISMAELDRANAAVDGARAAVKQAHASVSLARKEAQDTAVTSPIEGVIVGVHAHRGETVTMMPPTVVVEVQRLHPLEIRAKLPEGALRTIREGDPMQVRFTALGEVREARIRHIAPRVDAVTRMVEVRAEVDNEELILRSGMMVEVEVAAGQGVPSRAEASALEASTRGGNPS
jgi:membrane fusion protein (multidrug efflux system)